MDEEIVIYIPKEKLSSTVGKLWRGVLRSLIDQEVLKGYSDVVELRFDKEKTLHVQSILEFYDVRSVSSGPVKQFKREEDK